MRKWRGRWPGALLMLALVGGAMAEPVRLNSRGRDSAPIYIYGQGTVSGICPDVLAALEEVDPALRFNGIQEISSLPLIEQGLGSGFLDVHCGLGRSPTREAVAQVAGPALFAIQEVVAVRSEDQVSVPDYASLARLAQQPNGVVIVRRSSVFVAHLRDHGVLFDDQSADNDTNIQKLLAGRGRFFYNASYLLNHQIARLQLSGRIKLLPTIFNVEPVYLMASRQLDPALVKRLAQAIERIRDSGRLKTILQKYEVAEP